MNKRYSVDHAAMRDMNLTLILNTLHAKAPLSRAALAHITGLNKATVSSIVKDLLTNGLIRETGTNGTPVEVGRPAINLEPDPTAGYFIGVEIGVGFISIITVNFAIEIISHRYESTFTYYSQEKIIERLLFLLTESKQQVIKMQRPIFGIGIGVPGLVDIANGTLLFAPNLGWQDVPLRSLVETALNIPVYLANEANLAALGESVFGAGQGCKNMLYVSSGMGLGGGVILNGRLVEGATGFAGEVGHMLVERNGRRCNCGSHGCWETVAGQQALFRRVEEAITSGQSSWISSQIEADFNKLSIPLIVEAALKEDTVATNALQATAEWIGIGMASLMNVINPQRVILGGPMSAAHKQLLPIIRQTVTANSWHWVQDKVKIVPAAHGQDAAVMGGVAIVYRDVLNNPRKWLH
ncbi:MAG: ROK family transcriptional regulator [Anaerolineales bacterium]|nr:ROK family transcriptional regulator [Anaerolineales bacterium]